MNERIISYRTKLLGKQDVVVETAENRSRTLSRAMTTVLVTQLSYILPRRRRWTSCTPLHHDQPTDCCLTSLDPLFTQKHSCSFGLSRSTLCDDLPSAATRCHLKLRNTCSYTSVIDVHGWWGNQYMVIKVERQDDVLCVNSTCD